MLIKLRKLLFVLLFIAFTCFSQELVQNDSASEITFTIKNFGFNVAGSFNDFTISSNFNEETLKNSFFNAEIKVKSIFTDSKGRDAHLLESDYFAAVKYPTMLFESTEIAIEKNDTYRLTGFLTIKGVKKRVVTLLEITRLKTGITILTNFMLDRKNFGVGGNSLVLSDEVNIKMKYVGFRN
jgi:polyisoprenoid-binding protein YceI